MILAGGTKTVQNTFKDIDGNLYDPDTHSIQLYGPDGSAIGSAETSPINVSTGIFRQSFVITAGSNYGRYVIVWEVTTGGVVTSKHFPFYVITTVFPTCQEVRDYLSQVTDQRLTDDIIEPQIHLSVAEVDSLKSSSATQGQLASAYLALAGYKSYLAYANRYERSAGRLPAPVLANLQLYLDSANLYIGIASRKSTAMGPQSDVTSSLVTVRI